MEIETTLSCLLARNAVLRLRASPPDQFLAAVHDHRPLAIGGKLIAPSMQTGLQSARAVIAVPVALPFR